MSVSFIFLKTNVEKVWECLLEFNFDVKIHLETFACVKDLKMDSHRFANRFGF